MTGYCCVSLFFSVGIICISLFPNGVRAVGRHTKNKVDLIDEDMLSPVRTYNLEDFFWTGSGDGPLPPADRGPLRPPSITTTTVLATVFLDSPGSGRPVPNPPSSEEDCVSECPIFPPGGPIQPTRVNPGVNTGSDTGDGVSPPDPRYWILTVLRAPPASSTPLPPDLQRSLTKLYQRAFIRQQEHHLGLLPTTGVGLRKKHQTDVKHLTYSHNKNISSHSRESSGDEERSTIPTDVDDLSSTIATEVQIEGQNFEEEVLYSSTDSTIYNDNSGIFTVDDAFEYISNYFNVSPTNAIRLGRSIELKDELGDVVVKNFSAEVSSDNNSTGDLVKRAVYLNEEQPSVEVFLYNVTREGDGESDLRVVYWVSVGGRPVPARTATRDMRLLADAEVVAELGYPFTTKAEPYLKSPEPLNGVSKASNMRDTWVIVFGAILAALLLLILVAFLACRLVSRRKSSATNREVIRGDSLAQGVLYPGSGVGGNDNKGYSKEDGDGKLISVVSPSKKHGLPTLDERFVTSAGRFGRKTGNRVSSADSSGSSSGSDLSQMNAMLRQRQKLFDQQMQNEYATVNKKVKIKNRRMRSKKVGIADDPVSQGDIEISGDGTLQRFLVSGPSSPSPSDSSCDSVVVRCPRGVISPTSYLSMPSVKSFPRGNAVEPLSRVLEPLSVRHFDMDSPIHINPTKPSSKVSPEGVKSKVDPITNPEFPTKASPHLVRLGSLDKDPGVIGPMVWDLHKQRMQAKEMKTDPLDGSGTSMSKMRQRFNELVEDAFSLFGSGSNSPKSDQIEAPVRQVETSDNTGKLIPPSNLFGNRRHSAREGDQYEQEMERSMGPGRPHTALPPRPPLPRQIINPTSAWGSTTFVPMGRATSAGGGGHRPTVDVSMVKSDAALSPSDPAVPLLRAIRKELDKLPGTSDA